MSGVSGIGVRRRRRRRRGGRCGAGPGPAPGPRRAAWESMTTRRLPAPGPPSLRIPPRVGRPAWPEGWDCVSSRLGRLGGSGTEMMRGTRAARGRLDVRDQPGRLVVLALGGRGALGVGGCLCGGCCLCGGRLGLDGGRLGNRDDDLGTVGLRVDRRRRDRDLLSALRLGGGRGLLGRCRGGRGGLRGLGRGRGRSRRGLRSLRRDLLGRDRLGRLDLGRRRRGVRRGAGLARTAAAHLAARIDREVVEHGTARDRTGGLRRAARHHRLTGRHGRAPGPDARACRGRRVRRHPAGAGAQGRHDRRVRHWHGRAGRARQAGVPAGHDPRADARGRRGRAGSPPRGRADRGRRAARRRPGPRPWPPRARPWRSWPLRARLPSVAWKMVCRRRCRRRTCRRSSRAARRPPPRRRMRPSRQGPRPGACRERPCWTVPAPWRSHGFAFLPCSRIDSTKSSEISAGPLRARLTARRLTACSAHSGLHT